MHGFGRVLGQKGAAAQTYPVQGMHMHAHQGISAGGSPFFFSVTWYGVLFLMGLITSSVRNVQPHPLRCV